MMNGIFEYFAGNLTGEGFINYFPSIMKDVKELYIIKGTPGSGKSTLMKKTAALAEKKGYTVDRIYCSSDVSSLDGIIIRELALGMLDGTAPHVMEAKYPLALEKIINLGDFIDSEKVFKKRDKVFSLTDEKKLRFLEGEKLLGSALILRRLGKILTENSYEKEKGDKFCNNIIKTELSLKREGEQKSASFISFGKDGIVTLDTFGCAEKIYVLSPKYAHILLCTLRNLSLEFMVECVYSPSPFDKDEATAVYFPNTKRLIVSGEFYKPGKYEANIKNVSYERFCNTEKYKETKEKLSFFKKTENLILSQAASTFAESMKIHVEIEKIYSSALKKEQLNTFTDSFLNAVLNG